MLISDDYYMYSNFFVILFFQSRITAIGLFAYAFSCFVDAFISQHKDTNYRNLIHRGKNFTLLGGTIYLLGEFSGSIWCFLWWGDAWHWSKGFFLASIMFLLAMINSHLPSEINKSMSKKILLSAIPVLAIVITYIISH